MPWKLALWVHGSAEIYVRKNFQVRKTLSFSEYGRYVFCLKNFACTFCSTNKFVCTRKLTNPPGTFRSETASVLCITQLKVSLSNSIDSLTTANEIIQNAIKESTILFKSGDY